MKVRHPTLSGRACRTLVTAWATAGLAWSATLGNGLVEVRVRPERGCVDVIDVRRDAAIVRDARIGFTVAPYLELDDVGEGEFETEVEAVSFTSKAGRGGAMEQTPGATLVWVSRHPGQGELRVGFTLGPGRSGVEIGFSFTNLGDAPVRLRQVGVLTGGEVMPGADRASLRLLGGGSGLAKTTVRRDGQLQAENNALCFFADPQRPRSLVAGGLTYADYRKYVRFAGGRLDLLADDPVGRRVDPGETYHSPDRFYLDGSIANPFEALEAYARATQTARKIDLNSYSFPSTCMWFLAVDHFGGDAGSTNSTVGAVEEMRHIAESGFLRYSPVAVRLVPDCYEPNNQQGWWDDEHWQRHGRKERCVVERHYEEPYETTSKWASAIRGLGGIPLTYFQPGIRSEDYAEAHPGHMLYNQAHKYILKNGKKVGDPHWVMGDRGIPDYSKPGGWHPGYGKKWQESYDYTDPGFLQHWAEVNRNLRDGGVQGVFYDYPSRAFPQRGGMEDRKATATHAYRNVFRIAREQLGKEAWLQERLGPGSDATLEFVSSVRTAGDTNAISPRLITPVAMRWYKNRRLTHYDMDGKALIRTGHGDGVHPIDETERRAILTMSYVVSGRLLLTESFRLFSDEVLHDLSRLFPFHDTPLSARPLDAFIHDEPGVFDFPISQDWHQLVLYNGGDRPKDFEVPLGGDTAFGAMGLDGGRDFLVYDFWNDRFVGRVSGSIEQTVAPGEARMLAVHAVADRPQWISTDRHLLQGYVDLVEKPRWDAETGTLSGTSAVIGGEPYRITLACHGHVVETATAEGAEVEVEASGDDLVRLVLRSDANRQVLWRVGFRQAK